MTKIERSGTLSCQDWVDADDHGDDARCGLPATVVNHYRATVAGRSRSVSWSLCEFHARYWKAKSRIDDRYAPLVRPGDCPAVDDCIVRWTTDLASWAPSREEAA